MTSHDHLLYNNGGYLIPKGMWDDELHGVYMYHAKYRLTPNVRGPS